MCLPIFLHASVVLCLPTAAHFQHHTQPTQPLSQCQSGAVDRCRIRQRCLRFGHQRLVFLRLLGQKRLRIRVALLLVAPRTGQRQVAHTIRPLLRAGHDVVDLQRNLFGLTIETLSFPLFEQIFADFVAKQGALLVFHTLDLWILQALHVKTHRFHRNIRQRHPTPQPFSPLHHVLHTTFQTRGEPAFLSSAVQKARFAITGVSVPSRTPNTTTFIKGFFDRQSAMLEFGGEHTDLSAFVSGDDRESRDATAGIDLQTQGLCVRSGGLCKGDGEGKAPPHRSLALGEQLASTCRMTRHQRLFLLAEYQDSVFCHEYVTFPRMAGCSRNVRFGKVLLARLDERF